MISTDQRDIDTNSLDRFLRAAQRKIRLPGEVNVFITSDAEMRRLNNEFRGKNRPTDVLSFPASQDVNARIAGDIAISAQIARANAESLDHPFEVELKILLLHGLLHLAGHDHEGDNGEMALREQELRTDLMLPTGLIQRVEANGATKNHFAKRRPAMPSVSLAVKRKARGAQ
jgi:probable rRNA maturation factor